MILLGTIPAGLIAVLFGNIVEEKLRTPFVIGVSFIVWGIVLGVADKIGRLKDWKIKRIGELHWKNALFIGCAQAIALIPGTSRSGITLTAGLFSKLSKESAAEFSFLLSVPIIALAGLSGIRDVLGQTAEHIGLFPMFCGFIASMISGLFAIGILMKIIKRWNFTPFVLYRIIVGLLILFFL
jgi:undecaprenyl-diphosphatase